jgi:outer membrane autotransporter protein
MSVILTDGNAANNCIIGDGTTDCSVKIPSADTLTSGILNNGVINGDLAAGGGTWSAFDGNADFSYGIVNNGSMAAWVDTIGNRHQLTGGITNNLGATISGYHAIENGSNWTIVDSSYIDYIYNAGSLIGFNQNSGAGISDEFLGILNAGTIGTITNTGSIYAARNLSVSFGIRNRGTITTLNNAQGAGNVNGPLTLAGALPLTYNVIINSPSSYGQLVVTDGAGTSSFGIYSGSTVTSGTYTSVLTGLTSGNLTSTSGTFGSLNWQLVETSTGSKIWDLLFPAYSAPSASLSVSTSTFNEHKTQARGAAAIIDANQVLLDEFADLTGDQKIANAAESTLPIISGGVSQITTMTTNAVTDVISARQNITRGLASGDDFITDRHIWFKPFGGWTKQDNRQGVSGYDIDSYGLAMGIDGDVSSSWNVGVAFAYINSDVESNLVAGYHTIDMDSYQTKVYATNMLDEVTTLNLQAGVGISDYDSNRRIFNSDVANADYDSWNTQLNAELERSYQLSDKTEMTPYVHADYSYVSVESYNETGAGALSLNVGNDSADSLIVGTGVKANHAVSDVLLLMSDIGIGYDLMTDRSNLSSSFAGGGAQFTTDGIEPDEWVYNAGFGAQYSLANGTEITANYVINARQDYTDQSVSANFRMMF